MEDRGLALSATDVSENLDVPPDERGGSPDESGGRFAPRRRVVGARRGGENDPVDVAEFDPGWEPL